MNNFLNLFKNTFPNFNLISYISYIEDNLKDCKTILDIGCGDNSPLRLLNNKYQMTGVDGYKKALLESKKKKIHNDYIQLDITKLSRSFKNKSYDAVIALDVIEHLPKKEGDKLLMDMEKIARKVVILNTPNGFTKQHNKANDLQEHLSGWTSEDFKKAGYKVRGLYGYKPIYTFLRADDAGCRFQPRLFWGLIGGLLTELSHHLFTKHNPEYSFSLTATKRVD